MFTADFMQFPERGAEHERQSDTNLYSIYHARRRTSWHAVNFQPRIFSMSKDFGDEIDWESDSGRDPDYVSVYKTVVEFVLGGR